MATRRGAVRVGCGLVNPHLTCFMNASFQALFHLPPMVAWLEGEHRSSGGTFTGRLLRLYAKMQTGSEAVHAQEFCEPSVVQQICQGHSRGRMEDAAEWLTGLLGRVEEEGGGEEEDSVLQRVFGGRLRNQISCEEENFTRNVFERFASLEVELEQSTTLEQALASYTRQERLEGENKYRLEYEEDKFKMVDAVKRITISEAPNALMVVLKRFPLPDIKNNRQISFDTTLDLQPYMSDNSDARYDLNAVIVHSGSTTWSGHYYTYAKAADGMWYLFNDDSVVKVSESRVLGSQGYILFYTRNEPCTNSSSEPSTLVAKVRDSKEKHEGAGKNGKKRPLSQEDAETEFMTPISKRSKVCVGSSPFSCRTPEPVSSEDTVYETPIIMRRRNFSMNFPIGGLDTQSFPFCTPPPRGADTQINHRQKRAGNALQIAKSILKSAFGSKNKKRSRTNEECESSAKKKQRIFRSCRSEFQKTINPDKDLQ